MRKSDYVRRNRKRRLLLFLFFNNRYLSFGILPVAVRINDKPDHWHRASQLWLHAEKPCRRSSSCQPAQNPRPLGRRPCPTSTGCSTISPRLWRPWRRPPGRKTCPIYLAGRCYDLSLAPARAATPRRKPITHNWVLPGPFLAPRPRWDRRAPARHRDLGPDSVSKALRSRAAPSHGKMSSF